MREAETKLIWDSFSSTMAYLVYPHELREVIQRLLNESQGLQTFMEKLRDKISAETDPVHKTDLRIFFNELRKHVT